MLVLALPRGGVPVAYDVARALNAPLDVFLVRKLGVPGYEELAMGAVATGGVRVLNDQIVRNLRIPDYMIDSVAAREQQELARRQRLYRGGRQPPDVRGRTVILVERLVRIPAANVTLEGNLSLPEEARGVVLFAHGSGSSRHSPRNRHVARLLNEAKLATLLVDLLTPDEEAIDVLTARLRFDIGLLAERLIVTTDWLTQHPDTRPLRVGYFGASTGAAAALVAAAGRPDVVGAVVSRGGRPDLAGPALERVRAPTLLIVGGNDFPVIKLNEAALARLRSEKRLVVIPGATHLFEEPGALDEVARLAREWLERYLVPAESTE